MRHIKYTNVTLWAAIAGLIPIAVSMLYHVVHWYSAVTATDNCWSSQQYAHCPHSSSPQMCLLFCMTVTAYPHQLSTNALIRMIWQTVRCVACVLHKCCKPLTVSVAEIVWKLVSEFCYQFRITKSGTGKSVTIYYPHFKEICFKNEILMPDLGILLHTTDGTLPKNMDLHNSETTTMIF